MYFQKPSKQKRKKFIGAVYLYNATREKLQHIKGRIPTYQGKISNISSIEPQWNKHITSQYLLYLSGRYPVDVR